MKKSIYFLMMLLGLAFTGCEPMEDIHEEIDAELESKPIQGNVDYVLTEEDYETLDLAFGNFNSVEDARALIPGLLNTLYPVWGNGSLVNVTFDLYSPLNMEEYTVTEADYAAVGLDANYFADMDEITEFLSYQFPQASNGTFVELTYRTIPEEIGYEFTDEDFELIGEELGDVYDRPASSAAQYGNFERREGNAAYWSNEMILEAVDVVLSENFEGVEGQTYEVTYDIYDGEAGSEGMDVRFDGNNYVLAGATPYQLTNADFDLIGEELGDTYSGPAGNAAQFNSFDVVESSDNYWNEDMILEALNVVLQEEFQSAAEGAEFIVNYRVYNGSGTEAASTSVVLSGGEFIIDDTPPVVSTVVETTTFAYTNGEWDEPLTLERADYEEMGQSYPNFDDEEEALYKIEIFLEREFPYAEEGDVVAVAYDFFSGGTSTEYATFEFEGGEWNYIPSVIQETLQFGHNGTEWEPDNTIVYTMTEADFELVGEALADEYENPAWSAGNYSNFDRREGDRNYWSDEMLLEAINVVLDNLDPNAEEGQQYVVSFAVYTGTAGIQSLRVIKQDGEWVLNE